jgi:tetratricopeptide (TPR) repeat protein
MMKIHRVAVTGALLFAHLSVLAAAPRYDERGNIVKPTETKAEGFGTGTNTTSELGSDLQPSLASPALDGSGRVNPQVAPVVESPQSPQADAAEVPLAQPLTKVYLENAHMFRRSGRLDKALEYLGKSVEAGEDEFSQEARLMSIWLRARRGDRGLTATLESVDEKIRNIAMLRAADGYSACARDHGEKKAECAVEAERLYAFLGELAPRSSEGRLARIRLGLFLLDTGRHEAALPHLTQTLLRHGTNLADGKLSTEIPLDRAYFNLGQLYERPWYYRDAHKAVAAYKQVLKFSGSPYEKAARERIAYLRRFGTGHLRP